MYLYHNKTLTKIEVGTRDWVIAVIGMTIFLFGGIWMLGLWIRRAGELFRWGLMGQTIRNMEGSGAEDNLKCGFQRTRTFVRGLESVLVIFWQRMWLPFALV